MVSKEQVGTRMREVRAAQRKTLKDVEAASGFSSTHISEIERGRTSPTIGALIRIAYALDKDPSYFIEDRLLEEVCLTTADERPPALPGLEFQGEGLRLEGLTRGILGGRIRTYDLALDPKGNASISRVPEVGDLVLYCLSGRATLAFAGETSVLEAGDSLHVTADDAAMALSNEGVQEAHLLVMVDPKETR